MVSLQVNAQAPGHQSYIANKNGMGILHLSANGKAAPLYTGDDEYPGVKSAINSLHG